MLYRTDQCADNPCTLTCTIGGMKHQGKMIFTRTVRVVTSVIATSLLIVGLSACGNNSGSSTPSAAQSGSSQTQPKSDTSSSSQRQKSEDQKTMEQHSKPEKSTQHSFLGTSHSATSSPSSQPSSKMCMTSELTARLSQGAGAGAGSQYPYLILTNAGNRTCIERGFPGVSLQAGGKQIGAAANRDPLIAPRTLTLRPGQSAYSELAIVNADNFQSSQCSPQQADSMVIYPPDQRESIRIATTQFKGCVNQNNTILTVRALQAGRGE